MLKNIKRTIHRDAESRPRDEKHSRGNRRHSRDIGRCRHTDEKTRRERSNSRAKGGNKCRRKDERKHSPSARDLFRKKMDEERRALWLEEEKRRNALMEEEERHSRKRRKEDEARREEQAENEERQRMKFRSEIKETVNNTIEEKMREVMGEIVPQIMAAVSKKRKNSK